MVSKSSTQFRTLAWVSTLAALGLALLLGGCGAKPEADSANPDTPSPPAETTDADLSENTGPVPPPPPADSFLAQIPPDIATELNALEIPIIAPTYLPDGFDLVDYEAGVNEAANETVGAGPYYWLVYRDDTQRCFAIEYTSGGIGGPTLAQSMPINSPLFGSGYALYHGPFEDPNLATEFPEEDLFSDWLQKDTGFYRLIGAQLTMQTYKQSNCKNLPPEEAVKVIESMAYLSGELTAE